MDFGKYNAFFHHFSCAGRLHPFSAFLIEPNLYLVQQGKSLTFSTFQPVAFAAAN